MNRSSWKRLIAPTLMLSAVLAVTAKWLSQYPEEPKDIAFYIAGTVAGFAFSWFIARLVDVLLWGTIEGRGAHVPRLLKEMVAVGVFLAGGILILMLVFGQSVTGILAASGAIGLVLGLGMRNLIADVFSGVALNLDQPFKVGEWIQVFPRSVEPLKGCVVELTWRSTRIRTIENNLVVLPNSLISSSMMVNFSKPSAPSRFELPFVLDFNVPVDRALRVLLAAVKAAKGPLTDPPPRVTVRQALDWGVEYEVRYWLEPAVVSPRRGRHEVTTSVLAHLHHSGISLAKRKEEMFWARKETADRSRSQRRMDVLKRVDLFSNLETQELSTLADSMRERVFQAQEVIVEKGQPGESMYVLVEGLLDVYSHFGKPEERVRVETIRPGQFFGEMSLLTGEPRSATVMAVTDAVVYEIQKEDLNRLIESRPEIIVLLTQTVAARIDDLKAKGDLPREEKPVAPQTFAEQFLARMRAFFH